jgi:voltage-gated potassium channel Kch
VSGAGKVVKKLKFWDVGSPNISADHVAMVHKGERIVPKTFNQDLMSGKTMMLAPEALSSIMASFTGLGRQSVNISGVVPVMINDREIGRAAFEWLDVAAGGAYGY